MALHEIKRNDTRPEWATTLAFSDGETVTPVDLSGATVRFIARRRSDSQTKIDGVAVITDAEAGECEYRFVADDTDEAGDFDCEWEVSFSDGSIQTFPTRTHDRLTVIGDLG